MKIILFFYPIMFSFLDSFSIQISENGEYIKFLSKNNIRDEYSENQLSDTSLQSDIIDNELIEEAEYKEEGIAIDESEIESVYVEAEEKEDEEEIEEEEEKGNKEEDKEEEKDKGEQEEDKQKNNEEEDKEETKKDQEEKEELEETKSEKGEEKRNEEEKGKEEERGNENEEKDNENKENKEESETEKEEKKEEEKENEIETEEGKEDGPDSKKEENEEKEEKEEEKEVEEKETEPKETDKEPDNKRTYVNIKCLYVAKYNVYTLQKLTKDDEYTYNVNTSGIVHFNLCKNLKGYESTVVFEKNTSGTEIDNNKTLFSGSIDGNSKSKNEWLEMDEDNGDKGIKIRLAEGDKCEGNENKNHLTILQIYCDEEEEFATSVNFADFNPNGCIHYIRANSIYGCALNDWYLLRKLMKEHNYIFATVLFLVGIYFAFFGKKYEKPTIVLISGIFVCYIVTVIILSFIPQLIKTEQNLYILLAVGFIVGGIGGYLLREKLTIFAILIGAFSGYSVAEFVYQFLSGFITINPEILYFIVVGICILGGGFCGYWAVQAIIILGTAIIGGYIFMRGATTIFDNYMELAEFSDLAKNGEWEQLKDIRNGWVYAYLGLWIAVSVGGLYYQCYGYKKDKKDKDKDNKEDEKDDKKKKLKE